MPNPKYIKGAKRERDIIHYLEASGYICYRSSGSHGQADIIAIHYPRILFIQSKAASLSENKELKIFINMCKELKPDYYHLENKVLQGEWKEVKKNIDSWG